MEAVLGTIGGAIGLSVPDMWCALSRSGRKPVSNFFPPPTPCIFPTMPGRQPGGNPGRRRSGGKYSAAKSESGNSDRNNPRRAFLFIQLPPAGIQTIGCIRAERKAGYRTRLRTQQRNGAGLGRRTDFRARGCGTLRDEAGALPIKIAMAMVAMIVVVRIVLSWAPGNRTFGPRLTPLIVNRWLLPIRAARPRHCYAFAFHFSDNRGQQDWLKRSSQARAQ